MGVYMDYSASVIGYTKPVLHGLETPEELIAYCARVSSGRPQEEWGEDYSGLLKYCQRNSHWSIFSMADVVVEVDCPRDIARQILRHKSFDFQEFSQRYSDEITFTGRELRRQDTKNRQNSVDDFTDKDKIEWENDINMVKSMVGDLYDKWRDRGAAKECIRVILPEGLTMSKTMMKGSARSWLHYITVRDDWGVTQKEHVLVARAIKEALKTVLPTVIGGMDG